MTREKVHQLLDEYRDYGIGKHGTDNIGNSTQSPGFKLALLVEEVGELATELAQPSTDMNLKNLIAELCDVMACAAGWLESIDVPE